MSLRHFLIKQMVLIMKNNISYKLVGLKETFCHTKILIFKKIDSDLEINCHLDFVENIFHRISTKDISDIETLKAEYHNY